MVQFDDEDEHYRQEGAHLWQVKEAGSKKKPLSEHLPWHLPLKSVWLASLKQDVQRSVAIAQVLQLTEQAWQVLCSIT